GRALGRGGAGETIRIMNLASRSTVSGRVAGPGLVEVHP
ncbi:MAG TPA: flagellar basal body P-ring formation protein FlgA, partial [Paracoccus sp.]|nr:flagellar basal body P-ring formation protein FlgA [Paracoccus sp. (in: a-proteobacteria)]